MRFMWLVWRGGRGVIVGGMGGRSGTEVGRWGWMWVLQTGRGSKGGREGARIANSG
jgi:hypothetical protein